MAKRGAHHSIEQRIKRAGLEAAFRKLLQGYTEDGYQHEDAVRLSREQIKPAVMNWESQNRDVVTARRYVNQKKEKEAELRKAEFAKEIERKRRAGENFLAEAAALAELEEPKSRPGYKFKTDDPWGDLTMAIPPIAGDFFRDIWWVYNNISTPVEALSPTDGQSRGAVTMLKQARENPVMYAEFLRTQFAKLAPSKAELDSQARFRDENTKLMGMFDIFEQDLNKKYKSALKNTPTVDASGNILPDDEDTP